MIILCSLCLMGLVIFIWNRILNKIYLRLAGNIRQNLLNVRLRGSVYRYSPDALASVFENHPGQHYRRVCPKAKADYYYFPSDITLTVVINNKAKIISNQLIS